MLKTKNKIHKHILKFFSSFFRQQNYLCVRQSTFINHTTDSKEKINKNKIKNAVNSSSFSKLKDKERKEGFSEAPKSKGGDRKIPFFNLGPKNNWKIILNDDLKDKLNNIFKKKLEELSYQ